MTMPKRGRRKIIINGKTYYYKISHSCKCKYYCECYYLEDCYIAVVIEKPDGTFLTHKIYGKSKDSEFTPKDIKNLIGSEESNGD